ncbi:MAG: hypothetical protein Q8O89_08580 [Nanoarchaeota archaeon]|nr:hypothetical protein [Nanoarchaeota archaeon]
MKTAEHFSNLYAIVKQEGLKTALAYDAMTTLEKHPTARQLVGSTLYMFSELFPKEAANSQNENSQNLSQDDLIARLREENKINSIGYQSTNGESSEQTDGKARTFSLIATQSDGNYTETKKTAFKAADGKLKLFDAASFNREVFAAYMAVLVNEQRTENDV